ncbi:MerR family transcriptional regulator [Macrococcus carouselicus]|uniref:MerR family transcriptional regulator n=1 Tax=Macrococcus carouselicus TaxID=69969 RepID=A0A9Q8CJE8_9STAP|nr:MerR family transcriptional regulator [Macrococcus carouselicus]TDM02452.1 MerR family transcriptional regulator [Macrococcus carouselicus]
MVWRDINGKDLLKIGELAKQAGVTNRTIDYYTNMELLDFVRTSSNYRLYDVSMIDRVHQIENLKAQGKHLTEIRQIFTPERCDIQSQIKQLEQDIKRIAQSDNLEQIKQLATKDLAVVKTLLLLLH